MYIMCITFKAGHEKINGISKKLSKENRKAAQNDSLLSLADIFQGVVMKIDEEY